MEYNPILGDCNKCGQHFISMESMYDYMYENTEAAFGMGIDNICNICSIRYCTFCSTDNNIRFQECIKCFATLCDDCLIYKTLRVCKKCYPTFEICFKCLCKYHPNALHNCNADEGTYIKLLPNELKYIISNFAD